MRKHIHSLFLVAVVEGSDTYPIDLPYSNEARAESSSKLLSLSRVDSHHPDGKEFDLADLAVVSIVLKNKRPFFSRHIHCFVSRMALVVPLAI